MENINYLELGTIEIIDFLSSSNNLYSYSDSKFPAQYSRNRVNNQQIELFCYEKEQYIVYQQAIEINKLEFVIPIKHTLNIQIDCNLFIKNWVKDSDKILIVEAFNNYSATDGNIEDYIKSKLNDGLNEDMFSLFHSFSLFKLNQVRITTQRDNIIDATRNKLILNGNMDIISNETSLEGYYTKNDIEIRLKNPIEKIKGIPQDKIKNDHEIDIPKDTPIEEHKTYIEKLLESDIKNMGNIDCNINAIDRTEERIASTGSYPSGNFRYENIREFTLIDDCGITITCRTKWPEYQLVRKALYVYVGKTNNLTQIVKNQIKDCAVKGAVAGIVIGIVFENLEAALASFKAVFTECIKYMAKEDAKCLIPNLALLTEEVGWYWV